METKNAIIVNYIYALQNVVNNFITSATSLNLNVDENIATIKTLNVTLENIRSQTVLIQGALDNYFNER